MGKVFKPKEWYEAKLISSPILQKEKTKLSALETFIDFLEANNYYMSVIGSGRDTKNSSIYNAESTDPERWLCDVKFFSDANFADYLTVVGRERMNAADETYENPEFSKTLELLTGKLMEDSPFGNIKKQIIIDDYVRGLELMKTALSIYRVYR